MKEDHLKFKKDKIWKYIYHEFRDKVKDLNSLYDHQGIKGEENKRALLDFLKHFLPNKYQIEQRKILLDNNGIESKEQDLIIWNSNDYPKIFNNTDFLLLESILMTIEVKTTLNNHELIDCFQKIKHLRNLRFFKRLNGDKKWQIHPPLCFIFAYDSIWKKRRSLLQYINKTIKNIDIKPSERFDYLYIMNQGLEVNWNIPYKYYEKYHKTSGSNIIDSHGWKTIFENIAPINTRWPQFFPSKLIRDIPIVLKLSQLSQQEGRKEEYILKLNIENQIHSFVNFLYQTCQALDDQRILHPHGTIAMSNSGSKDGLSGLESEPF